MGHKVIGNLCAPIGCQKKIHLLLMFIVVGPSVPRLHIRRDDDTEPSKVCCATLGSLAARHLDQRREQFRFTGCGDDKGGSA